MSFILTPLGFSFRFKAVLFSKVLIPHFIFQLKARGYSKWSEILSSFKKIASLLQRYSRFHRTPPDRVVTWNFRVEYVRREAAVV